MKQNVDIARGEEEKCRRKDKGLEETGRSRRERRIGAAIERR